MDIQCVIINGIPGVLFPGPYMMFDHPEILGDFTCTYDLADDQGKGRPTIAHILGDEMLGDNYITPSGYLGTVALKEELGPYPMNVSVTEFETTGKFDLSEVRARVEKAFKGRTQENPALTKKAEKQPSVSEPASPIVRKPTTPFENIASVLDSGLRLLSDEISMIDLSKGTSGGVKTKNQDFVDNMVDLLVCIFGTLRYTVGLHAQGSAYDQIVSVSEPAMRSLLEEIEQVDLEAGTYKGKKVDNLEFKASMLDLLAPTFATVRFAASTTLEPEIEL